MNRVHKVRNWWLLTTTCHFAIVAGLAQWSAPNAEG
jgi:hypothetical protein